MRQPSTILLIIFYFIIAGLIPAYGAVKGGIEYSIPIDYSKLSENDLEIRGDELFYLAQKHKDRELNNDLTNALTVYSILQNISPENIKYSVRLGILYDKFGLDKYAKGNFSRAIGINSSDPEAYFYFGEFYYKRQLYRKALKYYNEAYKLGYDKNYELLYKIGDIYEKFGDTRSSLKYLKDASLQNPNTDLDNKIKSIEAKNDVNKEYYSDTRIRG